MKRREFLKYSTGAALGAALTLNGLQAGETSGVGDAKPMNVLFIASDDLRTSLGCYGDPIAITPNIDRLAKKSMVFKRAYCQQAVCAPSRASLMTGRRPDTIKVWDLTTHFRKAIPDLITLPQHFKLNGYHAQSIGKIYHDGYQSFGKADHDGTYSQDGLSWSVPQQGNIWRRWNDAGIWALPENNKPQGIRGMKGPAMECADVDDEAYRDGQIARDVIKTLELLKNHDKPFFLAAGFWKPHLPFCAPKKYWDMYDRKDLAYPSPANAPKGTPDLALHKSGELRGYKKIPHNGELSPELIAELRHAYYACVSYIDAQVDKLLDALDRLGLTENTIVILWGDHGYHIGEHHLWCKTTNFELDTHAPLILSVPGKTSKGQTTNALVEFVDIYPTLADLCGLEIPKNLEGLSMAPLLANPNRPWKKAAFSQFPRPWMYKDQPDVMGYSIRTNRFRYTEWQDFKTHHVRAAELYDHQTNPDETINLIDNLSYADQVSQLSKMLKTGWKKALPDF